jgi:hypothetical protein
LVAIGFVAAHGWVAHKEFRFVMPIAPLVLALAGAGLGAALDRLDRRHLSRGWIAAVIAIAMFLRIRTLTLGDMGQFADVAEWKASPPWNFFGGVNRAMAQAGEQEDLCGLTIDGIAPWWMGGFSYLHRDVPLFVGGSAAALASSNYFIVAQASAPPPDYHSVAAYAGYVLYRRAGSCAPRPAGYRHPLE